MTQPINSDIHSVSSLESEDSNINHLEPQELHASPNANVVDGIDKNYSHDANQPKSHSTGTNRNNDGDDETNKEDRNSLNNIKSNQSTRSKVPLKDRRGLFASLAILPEYEDPRNYPNKIKIFIVFQIALAAAVGPMGTSILLPAIDDVVNDLHTQVIMVNVSVGIYLLSLGIFPLWWSAFSENYGRRSIYIISFTLFLGFSIGAALSPNISSLIIFRVLCGGSSASVQAVGAGTIADLYPPQERGRAMGWYYLGPLMGPFLSPIIGGAVAQAWGWRATQWVLVIASGLADVLIIFGLPETLRKQDNMANIKAYLQKMREETGDSTTEEEKELETFPPLEQAQSYISRLSHSNHTSNKNNGTDDEEEDMIMNHNEGVGDSITPSLSRLDTSRSDYSKNVQLEMIQSQISKKVSNLSNAANSNQYKWKNFKSKSYELLIRPMHSVVLLTYPPVYLVILHSSICFSVVYFFNITISYEYGRDPYNFSTVIVGLLYIPNSVTYLIGSIVGGRWNDYLLRKYAQTHNGELRPESRISWNLVLATILFIPACMIFGWTLHYGLHWVLPLIGTSIFGFASMLVIGATATYLVDTLPGKGATGIAINNLARQILAAIGTFIVEPLIKALNPGVLYSIITGIILISSLSLVYLKRNGDSLRKKYDIGTYYERL